MIIRTAEAEDMQRWDEFVSAKPDASPYHLYAWKTALEKSYGHNCFYLLAEDRNRIQGILPLVLINPPFTKNILVSLPFCDIGGPVTDSSSISEKLIDAALQKGGETGAARLELRLQQEEVSLQNFKDPITVASHKVRMLLDLPASSDDLWKTFKSKLRSQVRKAEKNNLVFQWGSIDTINDFYAVFSRNMRDLGSPVHACNWLSSILNAYGTNAHLGLVYLSKKVIGGGIILTNRKRVCIPWASTLRKYNHLATNMLLYWNFLKFAADNGYTLFDFGRSTPGETTFRFKAQWGAEPVPLHWYTFNIDGSPGQEISEEISARSKAEMIWQKLPLPLANFFGPKIRKYISL